MGHNDAFKSNDTAVNLVSKPHVRRLLYFIVFILLDIPSLRTVRRKLDYHSTLNIAVTISHKNSRRGFRIPIEIVTEKQKRITGCESNAYLRIFREQCVRTRV